MDPRYVVVALALLGLVAAFFYLFLRKRTLPEEPIPEAWRQILKERVRYYRDLPPGKQTIFAKRVQGFLEDVSVVGAGLEVTPTDRLLVAASAEIPLFGFPDWRYPNIDEVILLGENFSRDFDPEASDRSILGLVGNRELSRAMVLSRPALHAGFRRHSDHNVGIHEFTHLLDMSDGEVDGNPDYYLEDGLVGPWMRLVQREMTKIRAGSSDLDAYGATNEAEFLAVASEYFFNRPEKLATDYPELFGMLEHIFRQDPRAKAPAETFARALKSGELE